MVVYKIRKIGTQLYYLHNYWVELEVAYEYKTQNLAQAISNSFMVPASEVVEFEKTYFEKGVFN